MDWEGIPASAKWMAEVRAAIDEADCFCFVVSPGLGRVPGLPGGGRPRRRLEQADPAPAAPGGPRRPGARDRGRPQLDRVRRHGRLRRGLRHPRQGPGDRTRAPAGPYPPARALQGVGGLGQGPLPPAARLGPVPGRGMARHLSRTRSPPPPRARPPTCSPRAKPPPAASAPWWARSRSPWCSHSCCRRSRSSSAARRRTPRAESSSREERAAESRSRELASASVGQLEADPELSLLLANEALESARTPEAVDALRQALTESSVRLTFAPTKGPSEPSRSVPMGRRS